MRASKPKARTFHIKNKNKKLVPFLLKPYPSGLRLPNLNRHCLSNLLLVLFHNLYYNREMIKRLIWHVLIWMPLEGSHIHYSESYLLGLKISSFRMSFVEFWLPFNKWETNLLIFIKMLLKFKGQIMYLVFNFYTIFQFGYFQMLVLWIDKYHLNI